MCDESSTTLQRMREEQARRNLKAVGLAVHIYHSSFQRLPTPASYAPDGRPLLSWRVSMLPYLGNQERKLFGRFRLDEPWDSLPNRQLIDAMPHVYRLSSAAPLPPGRTCILAVVSRKQKPVTMFVDGMELSFRDIKDGLANTICLVEAAREKAVTWTSPDDLKYDPDQPVVALGGHHGDGFLATMGGGRVVMISKRLRDTPEENTILLQMLFERNDSRGIPCVLGLR